MNKIYGCIFDYGGTIIEEIEYDCKKGMENIIKHVVSNPFQILVSDLTKLSKKIDEKLNRKNGYIKQFGNIEYPESISLKYIVDYYKLSFDCSLEELEYLFWEGAAKPKQINGANEMLEYLQKEGIKIGVISNVSFSQYALRKRITKIFPKIKFECFLSSATYGFRKPSEMIFDLGTRLMEIPKENLIFIGNDYENDVAGAKKFGLNAALYGGGYVKEALEINDNQFSDWYKFINWMKGREN